MSSAFHRPNPWIHLSAAALACLVWTGGAADPETAPELLPAAFGIWTDSAGSSWSVEAAGNIGRIGSSMVNSGLALQIDEEKFESSRPMMTADGKELVLQGIPLDTHPGLEVQRRIRLLDTPGGLLFAELFHNGSSDPLTISVGLSTNFSGNIKTFLSERGRTEPLLLGEFETSLIVLPGASQSSRAFLFTLAGASGGVRPTISSQNRYGIAFRYRLDLGPDESGVIVHHVAQIAIPQDLDRRTLLAASRPYALDALRSRFDPDWRDLAVNATEAPEATPRGLLKAGGWGALDENQTDSDLLAAGEATRLTGKVEGGPVALTSEYGSAEFPLERLSAISGSKREGGGSPRIYLRDGQIFTGTIAGGDLGFVPTGGARIALEAASLDRLLFSGSADPDAWPTDTAAVLETRAGDRLRLLAGEGPLLNFASAWGSLSVTAADLVWLRPAAGGVGHRLSLRGGTEIEGFIEGATLSVETAEFGSVTLPAAGIKQLVTERGWALRPGEALPAAGTLLLLPGEQRLQVSIGDATLPLFVEGTKMETATAEIRRMRRENSGRETHRLERWDGGVMVGKLAMDSLAATVAGRVWQVPIGDLAGIEFAPPALDEATSAKIESLIGKLGSADWATREAASRELGAFGYLARAITQRELAETTDPEVARRLRRLLADSP